MRKIGYFAMGDDGSSYYRMQGVMPYINDPEISLTDISHLNILSWATALPYDTIIIQRPHTEHHAGAILQAQIMGIKVIIDLDDDVLNVPEHNPAYEIYNGHNRKYVHECILYADEIWCSTEGIKKECSRYNKNIHVIPNAHNDYMFPVEQKKLFNAGSNMITYRGGRTHILDLFEKMHQIADVMNENPDHEFRFIGTQSYELESLTRENHSYTSRLPVIQYLRYLYDLNPLLMLCPLQNNKLNRSKSNISWMEATYAGAGFIGNKTLPEFNHDEIFNIDRLDLFRDYLVPSRIKDANEKSWKYIQENLLLSDINHLRIKRLLS